MSGTLTVPNVFTPLVTAPVSAIDDDFTAVETYVNTRQITFDILANRPAPGIAGRYYFSTDTNGGTLFADTGVAWQQLASGLSAAAAVGSGIVKLTLANDLGFPLIALDVDEGLCSSDENNPLARTLIDLPSPLAGTITGTWIQGTAQPKLDSGAAAPFAWYHVFMILNPTTANTDILFSTSATAPVLPSGYTRKRRIGSFRLDGANHILPFTQRGDSFLWTNTVLDVNANNPGTAAVVHAVPPVPTGVIVQAVLLVGAQNNSNGGDVEMLVSPLTTADEAPDPTNMTCAALVQNLTQGRVIVGLVPFTVWTDLNAQIRYRLSFSDANVFAIIRVVGWIDRRGQDS